MFIYNFHDAYMLSMYPFICQFCNVHIYYFRFLKIITDTYVQYMCITVKRLYNVNLFEVLFFHMHFFFFNTYSV